MREILQKQPEPAAQARRRNDLTFVGGFSAKEAKEYIVTRYREEKSQVLSISETSIKRFFMAPNKSFLSSHYYKEIFPVKQLKGTLLITVTESIRNKYRFEASPSRPLL